MIDHNISKLSNQEIKALIALRNDSLRKTVDEMHQLQRELYFLNSELKQRTYADKNT